MSPHHQLKTLFFDIETLPAGPQHEPVLRDLFSIRPGRSRTFEEYLRGTSLSGNWGRILCLGLALDDQPVVVLTGSEETILTSFWKHAATASQFVGHNILEFDLPFIGKRSVVQGVKPSRTIPMHRYQSEPVFDTMRQWDHWASASSTSLHQLALILSLESSKQGIDGSMVYDFHQRGRDDEIVAYCARDVELTRQVYRRLTFALS
ncbi:ribonuclease H-like domain-containing protein [Candidatus Berkelbacteria bacterium]|nr:ribonuclease H-like domain-containing protein [Candidatus Berkelbacteria bacterium]